MPRKNEIQRLKKILEQRKATIINFLNDGQISIDELKAQECKDDLDFAELSFDTFNEELVLTRLSCELKEVEYSLIQIEQNKYGVCEMCDDTIDYKRLKAKPYAKFCIVCREIYEKENKEK
jgi:DnaK suppressor protein